jgi:hypothetical protein
MKSVRLLLYNGREIKVHAVQTGMISVKENFLKQKEKDS